MIKATSPKFNILEHTAIALATTFYETGRSQGLKSVHKNARLYAFANLEKFMPHAIKHLMDILNSPTATQAMKDEIFDCLMERVNDPVAQSLAASSADTHLPDIDVAKLIPIKDLPTVIHDQRAVADFGINPLWRKKRR
jgi:hypothetical protein